MRKCTIMFVKLSIISTINIKHASKHVRINTHAVILRTLHELVGEAAGATLRTHVEEV